MATRTSLRGTYKNGAYTPVQIQGFAEAAVQGQVCHFAGRSAVALTDSAAGESVSFGFGGEWQFAAADLSGAVPGGPVYDDGDGVLSVTAGTDPAVGIVTSADAEIATVFLY